MSQHAGFRIAALTLAVAGVLQAQSTTPRDAWLMQNYRFTGPPAPGTVKPTNPVVSELWRIQNTIVSIMHKAKSEEDYEAALAAASQAAANAQAIGAISERLESAAAAKETAEEAKSNLPAPLYLIAFKDHTVAAATSYWADAFMLHYITQQGVHVQVRRDFIDRDLSARLNGERNLEFRLPD